MAVPWIGPTAHPTEEFECLDCAFVAPLSTHGRCQRCGSNAVSQCLILENTGEWITVAGERYWVPAESPCNQATILLPEKRSLEDDRKRKRNLAALPTAA